MKTEEINQPDSNIGSDVSTKPSKSRMKTNRENAQRKPTPTNAETDELSCAGDGSAIPIADDPKQTSELAQNQAEDLTATEILTDSAEATGKHKHTPVKAEPKKSRISAPSDNWIETESTGIAAIEDKGGTEPKGAPVEPAALDDAGEEPEATNDNPKKPKARAKRQKTARIKAKKKATRKAKAKNATPTKAAGKPMPGEAEARAAQVIGQANAPAGKVEGDKIKGAADGLGTPSPDPKDANDLPKDEPGGSAALENTGEETVATQEDDNKVVVPAIEVVAEIPKKLKEAASPIKMNGKPVLYRENARTVLNMESDFLHKKLCTGPVLNLCDTCGFGCVYCSSPSVARKFVHKTLAGRAHADVVVRRPNALELLEKQLANLSEEEKNYPHVVFASSLVDIAANKELMSTSFSLKPGVTHKLLGDASTLLNAAFQRRIMAFLCDDVRRNFLNKCDGLLQLSKVEMLVCDELPPEMREQIAKIQIEAKSEVGDKGRIMKLGAQRR